MKDTKLDLAVTEIKEAVNAVEKNLLLQKYGFIEPKLTEWEQTILRIEAQRIATYGIFNLLWEFEIAVDAPGRTS